LQNDTNHTHTHTHTRARALSDSSSRTCGQRGEGAIARTQSGCKVTCFASSHATHSLTLTLARTHLQHAYDHIRSCPRVVVMGGKRGVAMVTFGGSERGRSMHACVLSRTHTHFKCAEAKQTRTIRRPVVYLCPVTISSVSGAQQRGENNSRAAKKAGSNLAAPHRLFPYGRGRGWLVGHHRDVLALLTNERTRP
jgi:hypothetical protein